MGNFFAGIGGAIEALFYVLASVAFVAALLLVALAVLTWSAKTVGIL